MSVSRYETALQVCDSAAVELGKGNVTALFSSTDADIVLLRTLLNSCGRELGRAVRTGWRHLLKPGSFTAAAAVNPAVYGTQSLPTDFDFAIPGTWRDSTDDQLLRPVDEAEWEYHVTNLTAPDPSVMRLDGNSIWLYDPSAGDTITYRYSSRYWVKTSGQSAPDKSAATADTDTLYHDPLLLVRLLKLRWKQARGFDSVSEAQDFRDAFNDIAGGEQVVSAVRLGGSPTFKLIDNSNLPDRGWGA